VNGRRCSGPPAGLFLFFEARRNLPNRTSGPKRTCCSTIKSATIYLSIQFHRVRKSADAAPGHRTRTLPLAPLLTAFRGDRGNAPPTPSTDVASVEFLDSATDDQLAGALLATARDSLRFSFTRKYHPPRAVHPPRPEPPAPRTDSDSGARRALCVTPGEVYFVAGLGPGFWSAFWSARNLNVCPCGVRPSKLACSVSG